MIGNPPYGAKLSEEEVKFVKKNYSVDNSETAQVMMEKAHILLKDKGNHGFIVPKANVQKLREKIKYFIDNKNQIKIKGKISRKIAEKMSWKNMTDKYLEVYE